MYATNVSASSVNLDKAVFTKGSGEYTIGVASVKNKDVYKRQVRQWEMIIS